MKMLKLYLTFLLIIIAILSSNAQWIPCQGIEGANTEDIMIHDSELFIITSGNGIFKRHVSQNAWDSACLAGSFWKIRSTENALFCYGPMTYFYRTLDNGASWNYNEDYDWVYDMEVSDSVVFIIYDGMVMRSLDEGVSWMTVHPDSNSIEMTNLYAQTGQVFCADYGSDTIFHSTDNGESWMKLPVNGSKGYINDIYIFDEEIWMATDTSIYIYNDLLNLWTERSDFLPVKAYPQSFFEFENQLYCCSAKGLYFFDEQDSAWHDDNEGLESLIIRCGYPQGDTVFLATGSGPFYKISGSDWISDYNDLFQLDVGQVFKCGSRIYANVQGRFYYSDDITNEFTVLPVQVNYLFNKIVVTDTAWYAATNMGFSISLDSGLTWTEYSEGLGGKAVYEIAVTGSFYFAKIAGHAGIYRTRNDSIAWEWLPDEIGTANVWGITAINNVIFASVYGIQGLYRSVDYGLTFSVVPEGGDYAPEIFVKDNLIFILRDYSIIYFSDDEGETWQNWIAGFDEESIACMDLTNDHGTTILGGAIPPYVDYYLELFTPEVPYGIDIRGNLPFKFNPWITNVLFDNGRIIVTPNYYGLWYRDDLMVDIKDDDLSKITHSNSLLLFPNPVGDLLTIKKNNTIIDQGEFLIVDLSGKIMLRKPCELDKSEMTIDVSGLPQGVYFIVIRDDHGISITGKFVKTF
jgi:photosystem II stability/assembly factor-like uncharacterized protein